MLKVKMTFFSSSRPIHGLAVIKFEVALNCTTSSTGSENLI